MMDLSPHTPTHAHTYHQKLLKNYSEHLLNKDSKAAFIQEGLLQWGFVGERGWTQGSWTLIRTNGDVRARHRVGVSGWKIAKK